MLQDKINKKLWNAIKDNYEKANYTTAITNSMLYLNEVVQEKSGLVGLDNVDLMQQAFSVKNPKILVNKNQTQTEKNIQESMFYLTTGLCKLVRNPRSHKRYNDNQETADKIILFTDHILGFLENDLSLAIVDDWVEFILDENFNTTKKNSKDVFDRIPKIKRYDILTEIFRNRHNIPPNHNIQNILALLFDSLTPEQHNELITGFNKELVKCKIDNKLRSFFLIFPKEFWNELDILVRNRLEGMILKSVEKATILYDDDDVSGYGHIEEIGYNEESSLALWSKSFIDCFDNKDDILDTILEKLFIFGADSEKEFIQRELTGTLKKFGEDKILSFIKKYFSYLELNSDSREYKILSRCISEEKLDGYTKLTNPDYANDLKEINEDLPF